MGLGLAIVVGCIGRDRLRFNRERAGQLATMLILVLIALLLPAVFDFTGRFVVQRPNVDVTDEELSIGVSAVLILLYVANLIYTLVTHRDVFASDEPRDADKSWPIWISLLLLLIATAVIALEAELVSGALEATASASAFRRYFSG